MNEEQCFAYKNGKCKILRVNQCEGMSCRFFKTSEQLEEERKQSFERIQSLDPFVRNDIMKTYFSGKETGDGK